VFNALIVEDNPITQKLLETILLRRFKSEIRLAANGQDALKMISNEKPDFILLDYMMPLMNGYEFLRELRLKENYSDIPVIMVTAVSDQEAAKKIMELGIEDYLLKPINIDLMVEKISKIMFEKHKALKREFAKLNNEVDKFKKNNDEMLKNNIEIRINNMKFYLN